VSWTVVDVEMLKTGQRANAVVTADFDLDPSFVKRKRLNVRSVYEGLDCPSSVPKTGLYRQRIQAVPIKLKSLVIRMPTRVVLTRVVPTRVVLT
jgi:hypothetical protein